MAKGGQQLEARKTRSIGADGAEAMATEERQPVSNPGDIERALARFAEAAVSSPANPPSIPSELEGVLREIAAVGVPHYGWGGLKELLAARMVEAVAALKEDSGFLRAAGGKDYPQRRDELVASLRRFDAAPFTLQRLAEVLQDPRRQYSTTHKLINGLERLLAVSTTLPTAPRKTPASSLPPPPTPAAPASTPAPTPAGASTTESATTPTHGTATVVSSHDPASNGTPATATATTNASTAAAAATTATTTTAPGQEGAPSSGGLSSSPVAVKVEEQGAVGVVGDGAGASGSSNGSSDPALVPTDDESSPKEALADDKWEVESNGKREPGRKRHKVEVKPEAPVMSE